MILFDTAIIQFFNSFAQRWPYFDRAIACIEANDLFKGGVIIPLLWWLWFRKNGNDRIKEYLLATVAASLAALAVARALAAALPFRMRPIFDARLDFVPPYGAAPETLEGWSSFPSDHAVFFFALATGITLISRRMGWCALIYTFVAISLPRIYMGIHNPTDIMAGGVLGAVAVFFCCRDGLRERLTRRLLEWERARPEIFYACSFFVTFQMVILFYSVRDLGHRLLDLL